jgi:hypothetical protein
MAVEGETIRLRAKGEKSKKIPFQELPNLPKPVYTSIDLGITHTDLGLTRNSILALE